MTNITGYIVVLDCMPSICYLCDTTEALTQNIDEAMRFESYDEAWQTLSAICEKKESLHKYSKGWVKEI